MSTYEAENLLKVIREIHDQHADDLCWMPADVNKIFAAAGLPPQDLRVGDKVAMRRNCDRYTDCLESGGPWKSYAELEAENAILVADRATLVVGLEGCIESLKKVNKLEAENAKLEDENSMLKRSLEVVEASIISFSKSLAHKSGG